MEIDRKIGVWRLSNQRFTVLVEVDAQGTIIEAAPVVRRFRGQRFENICCWMQRHGKTDIMLLRVKSEGSKGDQIEKPETGVALSEPRLEALKPLFQTLCERASKTQADNQT